MMTGFQSGSRNQKTDFGGKSLGIQRLNTELQRQRDHDYLTKKLIIEIAKLRKLWNLLIQQPLSPQIWVLRTTTSSPILKNVGAGK